MPSGKLINAEDTLYNPTIIDDDGARAARRRRSGLDGEFKGVNVVQGEDKTFTA